MNETARAEPVQRRPSSPGQIRYLPDRGGIKVGFSETNINGQGNGGKLPNAAFQGSSLHLGHSLRGNGTE